MMTKFQKKETNYIDVLLQSNVSEEVEIKIDYETMK